MATAELSNSGLPQDAIAELTKLYAAAMENLRQTVLAPQGKTAKSREFKQARAAVLSHQIDALLNQLGHQSAAWIGQNLPQAMVDGIKRAETQARAAGIDVPTQPIGGSFSLIDQKTVELFAKEIAADLNGAAKAAGNNAKSVLRKTAQQDLSEAQIDRILAGGVIEGKPAQTIRTLRDQLRAVNGGKVIVKDKNGQPMEFDAGYYASMVARTKTREATTKARHQRLSELGLDLVAIVGRVSKNFCTGYLGMVFSISGKSSKYPALSDLPQGGPPFHPNCSKSTRPFSEDLASDKELDLADGVDDADQLLNVDSSTAQRNFKDLQIYQQVKQDYASTAEKLFGSK